MNPFVKRQFDIFTNKLKFKYNEKYNKLKSFTKKAYNATRQKVKDNKFKARKLIHNRLRKFLENQQKIIELEEDERRLLEEQEYERRQLEEEKKKLEEQTSKLSKSTENKEQGKLLENQEKIIDLEERLQRLLDEQDDQRKIIEEQRQKLEEQKQKLEEQTENKVQSNKSSNSKEVHDETKRAKKFINTKVRLQRIRQNIRTSRTKDKKKKDRYAKQIEWPEPAKAAAESENLVQLSQLSTPKLNPVAVAKHMSARKQPPPPPARTESQKAAAAVQFRPPPPPKRTDSQKARAEEAKQAAASVSESQKGAAKAAAAVQFRPPPPPARTASQKARAEEAKLAAARQQFNDALGQGLLNRRKLNQLSENSKKKIEENEKKKLVIDPIDQMLFDIKNVTLKKVQKKKGIENPEIVKPLTKKEIRAQNIEKLKLQIKNDPYNLRLQMDLRAMQMNPDGYDEENSSFY